MASVLQDITQSHFKAHSEEGIIILTRFFIRFLFFLKEERMSMAK